MSDIAQRVVSKLQVDASEGLELESRDWAELQRRPGRGSPSLIRACIY